MSTGRRISIAIVVLCAIAELAIGWMSELYWPMLAVGAVAAITVFRMPKM